MVGSAKIPTEAEIAEAFTIWHNNGQNAAAVADDLGRDRKTVWRWIKKYDWVERSKKIKRNIARAADRKIETEEMGTLKQVAKCLTEEFKAYFHKDHQAKGSPKDIILFAKYLDDAGKPNELAEALKAVANRDVVPFDSDLAEEVLCLLTEALAEQKERLDESGTGAE